MLAGNMKEVCMFLHLGMLKKTYEEVTEDIFDISKVRNIKEIENKK